MVNQITNDLFFGGGLLSWKSSASCGLNRTGGWILSQAQELEKKERKRKRKKRERERPFRLCDVLLFGPGEKCLLGCPLMPSLHQHVCTVNESHVTCGWFLRNYRLPVASVTHTHTHKNPTNILVIFFIPQLEKTALFVFFSTNTENPWLPGKPVWCFVVFECV